MKKIMWIGSIIIVSTYRPYATTEVSHIFKRQRSKIIKNVHKNLLKKANLTHLFHIIPFFHILDNGETDNKDKTLLVSPTSTLFNCTIWHSLCLQIVEILWTEMCTCCWNLTGYWEVSCIITSHIDSAHRIQFTRNLLGTHLLSIACFIVSSVNRFW